jgi:hypothetical protein
MQIYTRLRHFVSPPDDNNVNFDAFNIFKFLYLLFLPENVLLQSKCFFLLLGVVTDNYK